MQVLLQLEERFPPRILAHGSIIIETRRSGSFRVSFAFSFDRYKRERKDVRDPNQPLHPLNALHPELLPPDLALIPIGLVLPRTTRLLLRA